MLSGPNAQTRITAAHFIQRSPKGPNYEGVVGKGEPGMLMLKRPEVRQEGGGQEPDPEVE